MEALLAYDWPGNVRELQNVRARRVPRVTAALVATYHVVTTLPSRTEEASRDAGEHAPPGFLLWVSRLVHAHRGRLFGYARRRGLDAEDAVDAVQDSFVSFLKLPEARAIAREGDDALKLLTVILRHNIQNRARRRGSRARAQPLVVAEAMQADDETSEVLIARAEELARVNGCILRMTRLQRQVVTLSLLDEHPREEVAKLLGISDGYVRVLLHRAREHLRSCSFVYDDEEIAT